MSDYEVTLVNDNSGFPGCSLWNNEKNRLLTARFLNVLVSVNPLAASSCDVINLD